MLSAGFSSVAVIWSHQTQRIAMFICPGGSLAGTSGRSYPYVGCNCRRTIHRLESANSASTSPVFLARAPVAHPGVAGMPLVHLDG